LKRSTRRRQLKLFETGPAYLEVDLSLHTFSLAIAPIVEQAILFFSGTPVKALPPPSFAGTGVYALYYHGPFGLYAKLAAVNRQECKLPIYVGKAVARGRRTGRGADSEGPELSGRLRQHAWSIEFAENLRVEDFQCRFMILEGAAADLIVPVESELIRRYKALWNSGIDGFGNHDPGSGRYNQSPSKWDILHPGREWAKRLTGEAPRLAEVEAEVQQLLEQLPIP
jgi:hypothetical protein